MEMVSAEKLWKNLERIGKQLRLIRRVEEEDEYGRVKNVVVEQRDILGYIEYGITEKEVGVRGGYLITGDGRLWVKWNEEIKLNDRIIDPEGLEFSVIGFSHLVHQEDGEPVYKVWILSLVREDED